MPNYPYAIGDVFLFEADDSCLSQLICALSDSPVSHAAVYAGDGRILESGLPTVGSRTLDQLGTDRRIHIMGYKSPEKAAEALGPVLHRQEASQEPYSMGNLITVGLLLAGKSKLKKLPRVALALLRRVCLEIAHFIDAKKYPGRHPMTCSQFVFHCYLESGMPLKLDQNASQRDVAASAIAPESALALALSSGGLVLEQTAVREALQNEEEAGERSMPSPGDIMEKLCCIALNWMPASNRDMNDAEEAMTDADATELVHQAAVFGGLLLELGLDAAMLPEGITARGSAQDRLETIYEDFVSPGDLLLHCPDLTEKEVLNA
jgi:hypothetical protein